MRYDFVRLMAMTLLATMLMAGMWFGSQATARHAIGDAYAQGAAEAVRDAGVPDVAAPVGTVIVAPGGGVTVLKLPDPIEHPVETVSQVKKFWTYGGWQASVILIMIMASFCYTRLKPDDKDGDGEPDLDRGWKSKTWAISGALLVIGGPLLAKAVPGSEVTWSAVFMGVPVAIALLMKNLNPKKGAAQLPARPS